MNKNKVFKSILALLILFPVLVLIAQDSQSGFELRQLEGDWTGNGRVLIPITRIETDISGDATFEYDEKNNWLRTSITGTKFLFTYTDSGHLIIDSVTDSISWEVWDNYGKHAIYFGKVDSNLISGIRKKGKDIYSVSIELVTIDSLDFKLIQIKPDGKEISRASFSLWRVKE